MHRNIKVISSLFFHRIRKPPERQIPHTMRMRKIHGSCTWVFVHGSYTPYNIYQMIIHHELKRATSFLEPCSVITWPNLFHFLQTNICSCDTCWMTTVFIWLLFFKEYPINRLVIRFANHFNLFKLVWHFKWLNLANHPVNANSQMLRPTICCLTIF